MLIWTPSGKKSENIFGQFVEFYGLKIVEFYGFIATIQVSYFFMVLHFFVSHQNARTTVEKNCKYMQNKKNETLYSHDYTMILKTE